MIVRELSVQGFGCFAAPVKAGPLVDGLNVLFGPNGVGKSTLARAIAAALLDGHRVKAADMKALRPWGRRLAPRVTLEFEREGVRYRIEKQFLDGACAALLRRERDAWRPLMSNDDADEFLRRIMNGAAPAAGVAQPKHWGIAQVLWTAQGQLALPSLAPSVVESLQRAIGAQLTAAGAAVEKGIHELYGEYFQPKLGNLKKNARARTLADESALLKQNLEAARQELALWENEADRVEQLRSSLADARAEKERLENMLEGLRADAAEYAKIAARRDKTAERQRAAAAEYRRIDGDIEAILRLRAQIQSDCDESQSLRAALPAAEERRNAADEAEREAKRRFEQAQEEERDAQAALQSAQAAREYIQLLETRDGLEERLRAVASEDARIHRLESDRGALKVPADEEFAELRRTDESVRDAERRLELARVNVAIEPEINGEIAVEEGEAPGAIRVSSGTPLNIAGAPNVALRIPGFGTLRVTGPVSDYAAVRKQRDDALAALREFKNRFGASDPGQIESVRKRAAAIDGELAEARAARSARLAGKTVPALEDELAAATERIARIRLDHPAWIATPPEPDALEAEGRLRSEAATQAAREAFGNLDAAREEARQAAAACDALGGRLQLLAANIEKAKGELARRCGDESDEDRTRARQHAAMEYAACQEALAEAEKALAAYPGDPAARIPAADAARKAADARAQQCGQALVRAETKVEEMASRGLYSEFGALSEKLAAVEAERRREQLRMDAVALLRNTVETVKEELLTGISKPVEDRATSYLERICGRPRASIRLTREFGAGHVVPAELAGCEESAVDLDRMSGGEREQIWLCARLALAMEIARDERQFLLLDDVLTYTDNERMARICELLADLTDRLQVILFTCHPERYATIAGARLIDVEALARQEAAGSVGIRPRSR